MTVSSRTPEGEFGRCPVCQSEFVLEPSLSHGDATCPDCGQLVWFTRTVDGIRAFESIKDQVFFRLAEYLERRGLRNTRQRRTFARLVTAIESPFTADKLLDETRKLAGIDRLSKPTVYRSLNKFVDAGILTHSSNDGERHYTLA